MTRTETLAYGVIAPSSRQPLLEAMLRAFAWLVSHVVSLIGMIFNRSTRDCHTDEAEEAELSASNDTHASQPILRDDRFAIPQDEAGGRIKESRSPSKHQTTQALILRDLRTAQIVSKDGGVLTALYPLVPTNVETQGETQNLSCLAASSLHPRQNRSWIPTFVGMSGVCCAYPA